MSPAIAVAQGAPLGDLQNVRSDDNEDFSVGVMESACQRPGKRAPDLAEDARSRPARQPVLNPDSRRAAQRELRTHLRDPRAERSLRPPPLLSCLCVRRRPAETPAAGLDQVPRHRTEYLWPSGDESDMMPNRRGPLDANSLKHQPSRVLPALALNKHTRAPGLVLCTKFARSSSRCSETPTRPCASSASRRHSASR